MVPAPRDPPQIEPLSQAFPAGLAASPQRTASILGCDIHEILDASKVRGSDLQEIKANFPPPPSDPENPVVSDSSGGAFGSSSSLFDAGTGKNAGADETNKAKGSHTAHTAHSAVIQSYSEAREHVKCVGALVLVFAIWIALFACIAASSANYKEPDCKAFSKSVLAERGSCGECGSGTLVLPIFGEYEQSWPKPLRVILYTVAILCIFMGMGLICDQFMSAIEEITSVEKIVWRVVRDGAKHKFRVKIWNPTIANLTLMALGSSAPEILLSSTELIGRDYFAGSLGPSTIVGSAAFNLFCISAVCVSAIPPPTTRIIVGYGTFMVTALVSLLAYIWLLFILLISSPKKVDIVEGVITLVFFPIFLSVAFAADKGWGCFGTVPNHLTHEKLVLDKCKERMLEQFGHVVDTLPVDTLKLLMSSAHFPDATPTHINFKAACRKKITGKLTGGLTRLRSEEHCGTNRQRQTEIGFQVGFAEDRYVILESVGSLEVQVVMSCPVDSWVRMHYATREGTAKEGMRYTHVEGDLLFQPGCLSQWIAVPIIDDEEWEPQEEFYIGLSDLKVAPPRRRASEISEAAEVGHHNEAKNATGSWHVSATNRSQSKESCDSYEREFGSSSDLAMMMTPTNIFWKCQVTTVTVLNDDFPGTLDFDTDEILAHEGDIVKVGVCRSAGSSGCISCKYETINDTAMQGVDFEMTAGILEFAHGEKHKEIIIKIFKSRHHRYEDSERFRLKLFDASPGVVFDKNTAGGEAQAECDIIIAIDADDSTSFQTRFVTTLAKCINFDRWSVGLELWRQHARDSLFCGGSMADQAEAGAMDWVCHGISLIFKVLFVLVPPSILGNGWFCFLVALVMIGVVTALAGDVASLLGCCIGMPDDITAITLVALGTSLPDTLASRASAVQDQYADNAIGNITGSNSVNVFLGIGISWTIGAVYWDKVGPSSEWQQNQHGGVSFRDLYLDDHPGGGFFVPTDTLAFSVSAYVVGALCCLALLRYRRVRFGGELGGPQINQYIDAGLLAAIWVVYVASVSFYAGFS